MCSKELSRIVAAMFWISAKLTFVMLCVVPPVSLGAVHIVASS